MYIADYMKKIEKNDWFTTGLTILENDGFLKITIDNLCSILKVTKGSFYHHFGSIDGYIDALMKYWMEENTKSLIKKADQHKSIDDRMEALNNMVLLRSHKSEQLIRGWSFSNKIVEKYVTEVDEMRLAYTTKLREECGESAKKAKLLSMLEYACLVGIQQLYPTIPKVELKELYELFSSKTEISNQNNKI